MVPPPSTLGRYQVIREIARSCDIVFEGYDPSFNRRVAIKVLNVGAGEPDNVKADRIARFDREARAIGPLDHPNIMHVYDVGLDRGQSYMVMEFLEGVPLIKELLKRGVFTLDQAQPVLSQLLDGLGYAHARGVIHRDLKPENIQVLSDGTVKIMDFGIARIANETNLTQTGLVCGTINYLSPEQILGGTIDARSDLFAVGTITYQLLTGTLPFDRGTRDATVAAILASEPAIPRNFDPTVSTFIRKALSKAPDARYQSAKEMRDELMLLGNSPVLGHAKKALAMPPAAPLVPVPQAVAPVVQQRRAHVPVIVQNPPILAKIHTFSKGPLRWNVAKGVFLLCVLPLCIPAATFHLYALLYSIVGIALALWLLKPKREMIIGYVIALGTSFMFLAGYNAIASSISRAVQPSAPSSPSYASRNQQSSTTTSETNLKSSDDGGRFISPASSVLAKSGHPVKQRAFGATIRHRNPASHRSESGSSITIRPRPIHKQSMEDGSYITYKKRAIPSDDSGIPTNLHGDE